MDRYIVTVTVTCNNNRPLPWTASTILAHKLAPHFWGDRLLRVNHFGAHRKGLCCLLGCLVFWSPFLSFSANCMLFSESSTHFHIILHLSNIPSIVLYTKPSSSWTFGHFSSGLTSQIRLSRSVLGQFCTNCLDILSAQFVLSAALFGPRIRPISSRGCEDMEGLVIESPIIPQVLHLRSGCHGPFSVNFAPIA